MGIKTLGLSRYSLVIGDDLSLGAHSCNIADELEIGSGVTIGAMPLVIKDLPAGCTYYNVRQSQLLLLHPETAIVLTGLFSVP
ncbi:MULTISPECIES: hypothetical protein [Pseudomonadaceae]|uniref:Uncharacterized protein n=1 Tax=Pseudomonas denitrificans TaxID=43306 RepID=A0A9X7N2Q6_PSEDE|nr:MULTISPECIES: hypothetical protein [Pseudomonadaceae]OQR38331.1 hypothetical protein BWR15_02110 [Pseudomonas sp. T]MBD9515590.1 hypothetical protein [Pseudomonas sp. PDM22]MBD9633301.1 hypothetical protein [Pseudomonas sp. PDM19]MBD9686440.1 hypothetical protein [Pseudomonas sp. PDM20]QEY73921.1 hypothetical protein F1C79_21240 [Pseudomonas denitrificans (nom. rej.)]